MDKKNQKRLCYVIMPFSKHVGIDKKEWNSFFIDIFKPAIEVLDIDIDVKDRKFPTELLLKKLLKI